MKLKIIMVLLILLTPFISGCIIYGQGETIGYIYAIDDGILWDHVWYKSDLASSESDDYLLNNDLLKEQLRKLNSTTKVKLRYNRHLFTMSALSDSGTDDEIISYEVLQ